MSQKVGKFVEFTTNVNIATSGKSGINDTRALGNNYFMQTRNLLWGLYWPTDYVTGAPWELRYGSLAYNPLFFDNEWENTTKTLRISANEAMTVKILPELTFKTLISYDNTRTLDHLYYSPIHFQGSAAKGTVREMMTSSDKLVSSTTLNYSKTFA
jgi:hypothetical protein